MHRYMLLAFISFFVTNSIHESHVISHQSFNKVRDLARHKCPGFQLLVFSSATQEQKEGTPIFLYAKAIFAHHPCQSFVVFFFIIITYILIKSPDFYICVYRNFSYKNRVSLGLVQTILVWITLMHKLLLIYLIKCVYKIFNLLFGFFYIKKCVEKASILFFYDEKKKSNPRE